MKDAIKKAIEGGWIYNIEVGEIEDGIGHQVYEIAYCDPLFWQALMKGADLECNCGKTHCTIPTWQDRWHMFVDHLAEGKDVESFFRELIKDKN